MHAAALLSGPDPSCDSTAPASLPQRLPDRLVLVRHAESAGNLDATRYSETPDYEIPLSAHGHHQAQACGNQVRRGLTSQDVAHALHMAESISHSITSSLLSQARTPGCHAVQTLSPTPPTRRPCLG
jgi:hypothetical protein